MLNPDEECRFGDFVIRPSDNTVVRDGQSAQISPRVMEVLMYLIANHERVVPSDELLDRFWAGRVVEESTIHRHINQVRSALGDSARDPRYIRTVSKRGYQAIAPVERIPSSTGGKKRSWRIPALIGGTVIGLVVVVSYLSGAWVSPGRGSADGLPKLEDIETVAVLPLVNLSSNTRTGYFAEGLTDSILDELADGSIPKVASRTDTFKVAGENPDLATLAERLGVAYVVEGSVQQIGDEVRVITQLIRARDGFHIWSKTYVEPIADGFQIQEQIATNVAHIVQSKIMMDVEREYPGLFDKFDGADPEAIGLYVDSIEAFIDDVNGERGDAMYAMQLIEKAVLVDPDFGLAHRELAWNYIWRVNPSIPLAQSREAAHQAIEQYRRLRPEDTDVLWITAQACFQLDLDYAAAEAAILEGIEREPSWLWRWMLAGIAMREGRPSDAVRYFKMDSALDFESDSGVFLYNYANALRTIGDYRQSLEKFEQALRIVEGGAARAEGLALRARTMYDIGRIDEARTLAEQAWRASGAEAPHAFIALYAKLGETGRAQTLAAEIEPAGGNMGALVSGYVALGDTDRAFETLRAGIDDHDRTVLDAIRSDPDWEPLRGDARFAELLARLRSKETHTAAFQELEPNGLY